MEYGSVYDEGGGPSEKRSPRIVGSPESVYGEGVPSGGTMIAQDVKRNVLSSVNFNGQVTDRELRSHLTFVSQSRLFSIGNDNDR